MNRKRNSAKKSSVDCAGCTAWTRKYFDKGNEALSAFIIVFLSKINAIKYTDWEEFQTINPIIHTPHISGGGGELIPPLLKTHLRVSWDRSKVLIF